MRDLLLNTVGLTGFSLLAVGLWWLHPALSLVVCGGLMLFAAVYVILRPTRKEG